MPNCFAVSSSRRPRFIRGDCRLVSGSWPSRARRLARPERPTNGGEEHVRIGKRHGLSVEEISRVREGSEAVGWTEHEAALVAGAEELLGDFALHDHTWEVLARTYDELDLIDLIVVGREYAATAMLQNSLRIPLSGANLGLRQE